MREFAEWPCPVARVRGFQPEPELPFGDVPVGGGSRLGGPHPPLQNGTKRLADFARNLLLGIRPTNVKNGGYCLHFIQALEAAYAKSSSHGKQPCSN